MHRINVLCIVVLGRNARESAMSILMSNSRYPDYGVICYPIFVLYDLSHSQKLQLSQRFEQISTRKTCWGGQFYFILSMVRNLHCTNFLFYGMNRNFIDIEIRILFYLQFFEATVDFWFLMAWNGNNLVLFFGSKILQNFHFVSPESQNPDQSYLPVLM